MQCQSEKVMKIVNFKGQNFPQDTDKQLVRSCISTYEQFHK